MDFTRADEIIGELRRMNLTAAAAPSVLGALSGVQHLRGILDAIEIELARRLNDLTHNAPAHLAAATQRPRRSADRVYARAATLAATPSLDEPLQSGRLQGTHVDTVAKILRTVEEKHATQFTAALPDLIGAAASSNATPDDLARTLNRVARALQNDDGISRFQQQRRDTALHTWTDKRTGMLRLSGRLDPMSGLLLHNHIQAMIAALFAERVPSTCPTDPSAKQDHLRALALLALILQQPHAGLTLVPEPAEPADDTTADSSNGTADHVGHPAPDRSGPQRHTSRSRTTDPVTGHTRDTDEGSDNPHTDDTSDTSHGTNTDACADTETGIGNTGNDNSTDTEIGAETGGPHDAFDEWTSFFHRGPSRLGRPEVVVVLDARQQTLDANNGQPVTDWGLPIELPPRTLQDLFQRADAHPIIIANGIILHAPGELNLGRTTRLASRAQRRALRALYPTCAVPGCGVAYEFTKPHHVHHWEHGGPTDLHNLIPFCNQHHHCAHEGGWKITLQPNRTLTITRPDGTILTTGPPPRIRAA